MAESEVKSGVHTKDHRGEKTGSYDLAGFYEGYYYAHDCGSPYRRDEGWLRFFGGIADRIVGDINPGSVLDAGCAMGFLVEALRGRGVEAFGVDISEYAISKVHADIEPYCWVGGVTDPFPRRYDLIVCIEVFEHLTCDHAERAIENFGRHADDILFSSTPFDYSEVTHLNVQPPEHWGGLFAQQGYFRDVDFDASFITPWAVRFRRRQDPVHRIVRDYERRFWLLWKENVDLRRAAMDERMDLIAGRRDEVVGQVQAEPACSQGRSPGHKRDLPMRLVQCIDGWRRRAVKFSGRRL